MVEKRNYTCEAQLIRVLGCNTSLVVRGMIMSEDRNTAKKEFEAVCEKQGLRIDTQSVYARCDGDSGIMLRSGIRR